MEIQFSTATVEGNIEILRQLLTDGFNPNYVVEELGKEIKIGERNVIDHGHFDCLDLLLSHGLVLTNPGKLWKSTYYHGDKLKNILLKHHIPIDCQDEDGETILWEAIQNSKEFRQVLEQGANPTIRDNQGRNVYEYIIYKIDLDIENQLFYHLEYIDEERYYEYEPEFFTSVTLEPYIRCLDILRNYTNSTVL